MLREDSFFTGFSPRLLIRGHKKTPEAHLVKLCFSVSVKPSIDKGQAGSKTVRTNRTAYWKINCAGEPPPTFVWTHPKNGEISATGSDEFAILHEEYQGGSTTTLVIHHAKMNDAGTYSLQVNLSWSFRSFWESSF